MNDYYDDHLEDEKTDEVHSSRKQQVDIDETADAIKDGLTSLVELIASIAKLIRLFQKHS